ncbi:hypothetical protein TRFO_39525 [Tritrichomonas foetus]|uniref:Uncharacterized protein n=1 Tax=Tritrichomonas foetus TaxID=1144522 RepID=A0A1J4JAI9_9EUKA|nr:hypothetical protein TRFO_39525 [Tritrichomonas foetus]|eukprot:OHS94276.1 hypothetical protein TRFO_39525 [Tritrichomonas foetus]
MLTFDVKYYIYIMKKWELKLHHQETNLKGIMTSISYSPSGDLIVAGMSNGNILFFERRLDGSWSNIQSSTIKANTDKVDLSMQCLANPSVVDTDFVPVQRKCPMLLTAGEKEVKLWFISDHLEPTAPPDFVPHGLEFPPVYRSERLLTANQVTSFESQYGMKFSSVRCCPDGMNFAYCESKNVSIRRVDRINPSLMVYHSDSELTKLDYHPNENEIILIGDASGRANIVDMRVQPTQSTPNLRANASHLLANRFNYVNDCKFSADGTKFFTRHYSDLIFWDSRRTGNCLKKVPIKHDSESNDAHITTDGRDVFRSTWIDPKTVATGSFGGTLFLINTDGVITPKYITQTEQKESKFLLTQKARMSFAKEHQVNAIAISPNMNRLVASNTRSIQIYDLNAF